VKQGMSADIHLIPNSVLLLLVCLLFVKQLWLLNPCVATILQERMMQGISVPERVPQESIMY